MLIRRYAEPFMLAKDANVSPYTQIFKNNQFEVNKILLNDKKALNNPHSFSLRAKAGIFVRIPETEYTFAAHIRFAIEAIDELQQNALISLWMDKKFILQNWVTINTLKLIELNIYLKHKYNYSTYSSYQNHIAVMDIMCDSEMTFKISTQNIIIQLKRYHLFYQYPPPPELNYLHKAVSTEDQFSVAIQNQICMVIYNNHKYSHNDYTIFPCFATEKNKFDCLFNQLHCYQKFEEFDKFQRLYKYLYHTEPKNIKRCNNCQKYIMIYRKISKRKIQKKKCICKICKTTYYCGRKCQKYHWKYKHRYECAA